MAAKLARLTHKIAIQPHLVVESCTICSSCSRLSVRKLLDTPSYSVINASRFNARYQNCHSRLVYNVLKYKLKIHNSNRQIIQNILLEAHVMILRPSTAHLAQGKDKTHDAPAVSMLKGPPLDCYILYGGISRSFRTELITK
jgi:hypothetical protein